MVCSIVFCIWVSECIPLDAFRYLSAQNYGGLHLDTVPTHHLETSVFATNANVSQLSLYTDVSMHVFRQVVLISLDAIRSAPSRDTYHRHLTGLTGELHECRVSNIFLSYFPTNVNSYFYVTSKIRECFIFLSRVPCY